MRASVELNCVPTQSSRNEKKTKNKKTPPNLEWIRDSSTPPKSGNPSRHKLSDNPDNANIWRDMVSRLNLKQEDVTTRQPVLSDAGEQLAAADITSQDSRKWTNHAPWRECSTVYGSNVQPHPHKYGLLGRAIRIKPVLCSKHKIQHPRFSKEHLLGRIHFRKDSCGLMRLK